MKKITTLILSILMPFLLLVVFNLFVHKGEAATGATIIVNPESDIQQVGPPWYKPNWNYRHPVLISNNSDVSLTDYQVLIKLDSSNFDFNKADDEGWDVRLTTNDGITEIDYWIESWNKGSQTAYLWVEVPILEVGYTTIYLYYNNPGVTTANDGSATFIFFDDDWNQFKGAGCPIGTPWDCINPGATVSLGNLVLLSNTGISTYSPFLHKAVGYRANFGLGTGLISGGFSNGGAVGPRTVIRDLLNDVDDLYLQDFANSYIENNLLERVGGIDWHNNFHIYEIRWWIDDQNWENNQSIGDIDHGRTSVESVFPSEVPTDTLSVSFNNSEGSNATLLVDWVYVRKYNYPEPSATISEEQGLVDLEVSMVVSPDPLYAGEAITYLMTITNTSDIDALGVILTDTLPAGVNLARAIPSQGSCNNEIICNLGTISANLTASITVVVTTRIDELINTAVVGSTDYDLNLNNNTYQVAIEVIPSADLALTINGYPEVIKSNDLITYTLSITNYGPSEAVLAEAVEYLPTGVDYWSASPKICKKSGGNVTCTIGSLDLNTGTQILIIGKALQTTTGTLISTATISSITHDPNPTNNTSNEETLLDANKPVVNWVSPVQNENTYITDENRTILIASASDNDQIAWVEFKLWDHLLKPEADWVLIGTDTSEPYQVEFDSDDLEPGELYQLYVYAYDRAGNNVRQRILFKRLPIIFMPIIIRK